jgi:hypothetical protein
MLIFLYQDLKWDIQLIMKLAHHGKVQLPVFIENVRYSAFKPKYPSKVTIG